MPVAAPRRETALWVCDDAYGRPVAALGCCPCLRVGFVVALEVVSIIGPFSGGLLFLPVALLSAAP